MHIVEIAVIRKLLYNQSYFVTISRRSIPKYWRRVTVTIAPLNATWGTRWLSVVKKIGGSRLYNSTKIVIPKQVVVDLKVLKGDYIWLRIEDGVLEDVELPEIPYIADIRGVHGESPFILVSKNYLDTLITALGRNRWSGDVYIAVRTPEGKVFRFIKTLRKTESQNDIYRFHISNVNLRKIMKEQKSGVKLYIVIAPLPLGIQKPLEQVFPI